MNVLRRISMFNLSEFQWYRLQKIQYFQRQTIIAFIFYSTTRQSVSPNAELCTINSVHQH